MMCSLRQSSHLTRLVLPLCNDLLLKAVSVYCRKLKELEITLSLDASEEGLLALAGVRHGRGHLWSRRCDWLRTQEYWHSLLLLRLLERKSGGRW